MASHSGDDELVCGTIKSEDGFPVLALHLLDEHPDIKAINLQERSRR
ncbi:MAG: hypothetical protein M3R51_07050 [Candidatus Eremiobacteraeota bacterium]|nr:hypothetical protein [Candidatus Eremiobacteraeota bacterium]